MNVTSKDSCPACSGRRVEMGGGWCQRCMGSGRRLAAEAPGWDANGSPQGGTPRAMCDRCGLVEADGLCEPCHHFVFKGLTPYDGGTPRGPELDADTKREGES